MLSKVDEFVSTSSTWNLKNKDITIKNANCMIVPIPLIINPTLIASLPLISLIIYPTSSGI